LNIVDCGLWQNNAIEVLLFFDGAPSKYFFVEGGLLLLVIG
jgi:hypothetical protein